MSVSENANERKLVIQINKTYSLDSGMQTPQLKKINLYEGLDHPSIGSMLLWETAGHRLKEAALTADQIQQLFQQIEQNATASGSNRTALGKGKDAASAVNKAWNDLKGKIQNSKPVEDFDQKVSDILSKIGMGAEDPKFNGQVSSWVQKYRKFAKERPILQGAIYATLIALAGITGAGIGGAVALGLLKMADQLLQGKRASSAAYSGVKAGAMAFAASKLGDLIKGMKPGDEIPKSFPDGTDVSDIPGVPKMDFQKYDYYLGNSNNVVAVPKGAPNPFTGGGAGGIGNIDGADIVPRGAQFSSFEPISKKLSEGQVYMIFDRVSRQQLTEGPMDFIKGAVVKGKEKLQTVGKNLTTKITADKLNKAWQAAGSPMDSAELNKFLQAQGVDTAVVDKVYKDLKLPVGGSTVASDSIYKQVKDQVVKLDSKSKKRIAAYLQKQLGTA